LNSHSCGLKKIEIKLKKATENIGCGNLEAVHSFTSSSQPMASLVNKPVPSYPTSSKKKTDFTKVDKEIEKDLSKDKPEGEGTLNDLFK